MKKSTKKTRKQSKGASAAKKATRKAAAEAEGTSVTETKPAKRTRTREAAGDPKAKRLSTLDAAAQVLAQAGKPMRAQELIAAMAERGLWTSPGGKTPHATLYAAMMRETRDKGAASRFRKAERGQFAYNGKEA